MKSLAYAGLFYAIIDENLGVYIMSTNKDGFVAGQEVSFEELVKFRAKKQKEASNAANKQPAKRSSAKSAVDDSGEQSPSEGATEEA